MEESLQERSFSRPHPLQKSQKEESSDGLLDEKFPVRDGFQFPSLDFLGPPMNSNFSNDQQDVQKDRVIEAFENFGIHIKKIEAHVGPTLTLFEIVPEELTRVSKIRTLKDDIALHLATKGIRIISPIPGRGTIGIEIPNEKRTTFSLRQALESEEFKNQKCELPIAVGCTVTNETLVADLTKIPHLLVAGGPGTGKSIALHSIINTLLYTKKPNDLKLILVDPKRVEFGLYSDLGDSYFAHIPGEDGIVMTAKGTINYLNQLVIEMENRFTAFETLRVRNIVEYNQRCKENADGIIDAEGNKKFEHMPYIVCIIDEFCDLMLSGGNDIETPLVNIAQKGRAVGIHLIIATQRPTVSVISGLIKASFPGRMAFTVAQMIDSRIILDQNGAQNLIGKGDMLFSMGGNITRVQSPYIDSPEIKNVCNYLTLETSINHRAPYMLATRLEKYSLDKGEEDRDPLFDEAARWVVTADLVSTSSLQRRYQIGYNRAGSIMGQLEAEGIVSSSTGGRPRKVLKTPIEVELLLTQLNSYM